MLTIRKKRPEAEAAATEAPTEAPVEAAAAPVAEPLGLEPAATGPSGGVSAKQFRVAAILGLIAAVCVIVLLALQFAEFSFYKADPSVWPVK